MATSIISKACTKCRAYKATDEFCKSINTKDGLSYTCRACSYLANVAYIAKNSEKAKAARVAYRAANKEKIKAYKVAYRATNTEAVKSAETAYRVANKDKIKAISAAYYAENSEKKKAYSVNYYAMYTERVRAALLAYQKANPEARKTIGQNYRARKKSATGKLSKGLSTKLFKLQKGMCPCCAQPLGDDYHLDHVFPLALGGSNTDDNAQLLRKTCNLQKSKKHPVTFMQERGFLL